MIAASDEQTLRVLYVTAPDSPDAAAVLQDLASLEPGLDHQTVFGAAAALTEVRTVGGYSALFVGPTLPHNETLALIASLRRDRHPIAIVTIIADDDRPFFAPAITAGADDVLVLREGQLIAVEETLRRVRTSRHIEHGQDRPLLRVLYAGDDELAWGLIGEQPFLHADRTSADQDGAVSLLMESSEFAGDPCDVLVIDEHPGAAHALEVVKWVRTRMPDLPVVVLTPPTGSDVGGAALELGADEVVSKAGTYRRRLVATLHRLFLRRLAREAVPVHRDDAPHLGSTADSPHSPAEFAGLDPSFAAQSGAEDAPAVPDVSEAIETLEIERTRLAEALRKAEARAEQLRVQHDQVVESHGVDRSLRDREREELASLGQMLAEERERRIVLEETLGQVEGRAEELRLQHQEAIESQASERDRHEQARSELELVRQELGKERERLDAFEQTLREAEARAEHMRVKHDQVVEAQGLEHGLRNREREELASVHQTLTEEREQHERARSELALVRQELAEERERFDLYEETLREAEARAEHLREQHDQVVQAQGFENGQRDREREEHASLRQTLAEERERNEQARSALALLRQELNEEHERRVALQESVGQAEALAEQLRAEHHEALKSKESERERHDRKFAELASAREELNGERERRLALEDALRKSEASAGQLQAQHDQLVESQGFERALRDRDRADLASLRQVLTEERERRIVLEETLRQTEDKTRGQLESLEAEGRAIRQRLEDQLAAAADRLHSIASDTQTLQSDLEHEISAHAADRERMAERGLFGYAVFTAEGVLVRCSSSFAEMFGFGSPQTAVESSGGRAFPGVPDHARVIETLRSGALLERASSTARRSDGRPFRVLTAAAFAGDDRDGLVERLFVDISDRGQLETDLRLSRRLEAAGRLAAEMASEIESLLPAPQPSSDYSASVARGVSLVRQLLAFSRRQGRPAGFLSLTDAIRRSESLLRSVAGDTVELQFSLADVDSVAAGEEDVEHLLVELVFSAVSLLPYGGTVAIDTTSIATDLVLNTQLSATAAGYGVLPVTASASLARTAARCGGSVRTSGEAARTSALHVVLPC